MRLFGFFRQSSLRSLWRDRTANALMLTAFALPFVIGAAGLGVHTIELTLVNRRLQREADSAALAGAYSLYQNQGNTVATAAANQALTQNNLVSNVTSTITPGSYTTGSTTYTSAMFVSLSHTESTPFMRIFGMSTTTIAAQARAAVVPEGDVCALALVTSGVGVNVQGSSAINLGCGVGSNGTGTTVTSTGGNASMTATPVISHGSIDATAFSAGTTLMENHDVMPDPFASSNLTPSNSAVSNGQCNQNISVGSNNTLSGSPGCYGTISVGSNATLNLSSGIYYITNTANNGGLQVGAGAHLNCTGCTFVLTTTANSVTSTTQLATMSINGSAVLNLTATTDTTSPYYNILIYRDKRGASGGNQCCTIVGNAGGTITGAIYAPNDNLTFTGSTGFSTNCLFLVALTLSFQGNAAIDNSCTPPGNPGAWSLTSVRLVS